MPDLYVVFDGDAYMGLAATLADATVVARSARHPPDLALDVEWVPTVPHGWTLRGTGYRVILQPVTNMGLVQLTPVRR